MSQQGGQTLSDMLPRAAIESATFDDFVAALHPCIVTHDVTPEKIKARLQLSQYGDGIEWVNSAHGDWPTGNATALATIAAAFYDHRGCRLINEIQISGVAFIVR